MKPLQSSPYRDLAKVLADELGVSKEQCAEFVTHASAAADSYKDTISSVTVGTHPAKSIRKFEQLAAAARRLAHGVKRLDDRERAWLRSATDRGVEWPEQWLANASENAKILALTAARIQAAYRRGITDSTTPALEILIRDVAPIYRGVLDKQPGPDPRGKFYSVMEAILRCAKIQDSLPGKRKMEQILKSAISDN
jgi:hypothetical protein